MGSICTLNPMRDSTADKLPSGALFSGGIDRIMRGGRVWQWDNGEGVHVYIRLILLVREKDGGYRTSRRGVDVEKGGAW